MPDIYIGIIIGGLLINAIWLIGTFIKGHKTDGKLVVDLSGEGSPVALDLSGFRKMDTAKRVTLDFEVIMPEEEVE